jgi:hypothetical protein
MVRKERLELSRREALEPKSTSFIIHEACCTMHPINFQTHYLENSGKSAAPINTKDHT